MSDGESGAVFQPPGKKLEERPAVPEQGFRPERQVFLSAGLSLSAPISGGPEGDIRPGPHCFTLLEPVRSIVLIRLYKLRHNIVRSAIERTVRRWAGRAWKQGEISRETFRNCGTAWLKTNKTNEIFRPVRIEGPSREDSLDFVSRRA